jgi:hypothetical protein
VRHDRPGLLPRGVTHKPKRCAGYGCRLWGLGSPCAARADRRGHVIRWRGLRRRRVGHPSRRMVSRHTVRAPAAMARDARGSIRPPQPACPPSPRLRDGPGQAPPPRVLHGLQWPAAPLGQCLAPDRALAVPRFATARRKAEHVDRPRLSLSTPLAPFDCEASQLDQPRLLRMQRSLDLAHTCPPCSPAPFGLIPVCEAHDASVGVAPAAHSPACVLPPPSVGPQGQDVVQGASRLTIFD